MHIFSPFSICQLRGVSLTFPKVDKNKYGVQIELLVFKYCSHSLAFELRLHGQIPYRVHAP